MKKAEASICSLSEIPHKSELNYKEVPSFYFYENNNKSKTTLEEPCICGCNTPILFSRRLPQVPFSSPKENFTALFTLFGPVDYVSKPCKLLDTSINVYDLFHSILKVRKNLGRVSWRSVMKTMGLPKSHRDLRKAIRTFYKKYLKAIEVWIMEKGPVTIGCINTQVVVTILKEFLPGSCKRSEEGHESTQESESVKEEDDIPSEVYELLQELVTKVEAEFQDPWDFLKKRQAKKPSLPDLNAVKYDKPIFKVEYLKRPKAPKEPKELKEPKEPKEPKKEEKHSEPPKKKRKLQECYIPNLMTPEFRSKDPSGMGFKTHFKSRYLPIELQKEQQRQEQLFQSNEPKAHFIRKKQSALNIKRCCGVTYVVPSESKQVGVSDSFSPLPPLAFQVGTLERIVPEDERSYYSQVSRVYIKELFNSSGLIRCTIQNNYGEHELKEMVLGNSEEGQEIFFEEISELWRVLGKDSFVVLHFQMDSHNLLQPALPGKRGNILIGFLVKKGLCGTKSVKRCLNLEELATDPLNMYAYQLRTELYLTKAMWEMADSHTKKLLCSFIAEFEVFIQGMLPKWNSLREEVYKQKKMEPRKGILSLSKRCNCVPEALHTTPEGTWTQSSTEVKLITSTCPTCKETTMHADYNFENGISKLLDSKQPPNVFYLINTRDSFSYDLKVKKTLLKVNGRKVTKKEYFFDKKDMPNNFKEYERHREGNWVRVGITTYSGFFSQEELNNLEELARNTENDFQKGRFITNTAQPTYGAGGHIKRTKFFFGSRYMWTACQLAERQSKVAAGVRVDVSPTPKWMKEGIEEPLVEAGIIEKDFINSIAMNIYHDGKEGLAQHFDDAVRFKQPIYTVKLGSDSRLSFGSQFYGYLNGAFCIPCPRGVVCVMEECSYAANAAKHCVRPCDLTGRSITLILRQIHPFIMEEALKYDEQVDLPTWFSCLSIDEEAVSYSKQKELEAKRLLNGSTEIEETMEYLIQNVCKILKQETKA